MVRYVRDPDKSRRILDMDLFSGVVSLFIGHRRKMLRACIKQAPPELGGRDLWLKIFDQHAIDPDPPAGGAFSRAIRRFGRLLLPLRAGGVTQRAAAGDPPCQLLACRGEGPWRHF